MGLPVLDRPFRFPAEREAMISPKGCSWGESIPEQICLVYGLRPSTITRIIRRRKPQ